MLETLITNKTRLKLLLKFFLNSNSSSYLRNLENEFDESSNAIRIELNRFEEAGLLVSNSERNRKIFRANVMHPLFPDIHNILLKYIGFDQIIDKLVHKLAGINKAYIIGDFAKGKDAKKIELILIGTEFDKKYLDHLLNKIEDLIKRKVSCMILNEQEEYQYMDRHPEAFVLWKVNQRSDA
jgi:predicted transcriptional regulator